MLQLLVLLSSFLTIIHCITIESDPNQVVRAGETTSIDIRISMKNDQLPLNTPLKVQLTLESSGKGCPPSSEISQTCSPKDFFVERTLPESGEFIITPKFPEQVDFSMVNQHLIAKIQVTANGRSFTAGNTRVSAKISGAAPVVLASSNAISAGQTGISLTIKGTGFSRYAEQIADIQIRAAEESGRFSKPTLQVLAATATSLEAQLFTSCNGQDMSIADTSLVGNTIELTRLQIASSNQVFAGSAVITDKIEGPTEACEFRTESLIQDFTTSRVRLLGSCFTCNAEALEVKLSSSSGVGAVPKAEIMVVSLTEVEFAFTSCQGDLQGTDVSLTGSKLQAQVIIKSAVPQKSNIVTISDRFSAPKPFFNATGIQLSSGNTSLTMPASGFSCSPEHNSFEAIPFADGSKYHLPMMNVTQVDPSTITLRFSSCKNVSGIDMSMAGSVLEVEGAIAGFVPVKSDRSVLGGPITGTPPVVNSSSPELLEGGMLELFISGRGFSCDPALTLVNFTSDGNAGSLPYGQLREEEVNSSFLTTDLYTPGTSGDFPGLDFSLLGQQLSMEVKVLSRMNYESSKLILSNVSGSSPQILSNATSSAICTEQSDPLQFTIEAGGVPYDTKFLEVSLTAQSVEMSSARAVGIVSDGSKQLVTIQIDPKETQIFDKFLTHSLILKLRVTTTGLETKATIVGGIGDCVIRGNGKPEDSSAGLSGTYIAIIVIVCLAVIGSIVEWYVVIGRRRKENEVAEANELQFQSLETPAGPLTPRETIAVL